MTLLGSALIRTSGSSNGNTIRTRTQAFTPSRSAINHINTLHDFVRGSAKTSCHDLHDYCSI